MPDRNPDFQARLLEVFKIEAREHLDAISATLVEIDRARPADRARAVEVAFREAHSLKAAARAVNQDEIERVCQAMESVFAAIKGGELDAYRSLIDALQFATDAADGLLAAIDHGIDAAQLARAANAAAALDAMRSGEPAPPAAQAIADSAAAQPALAVASADTVRLSVRSLDALLLQAEELLSVKLAAQRHVAAIAQARAGLGELRTQWQRGAALLAPRRGPASTGPALAPQLQQDLAARSVQRLARLETDLAQAGRAAANDSREVGAKVDRLLDQIKRVLMIECRTVLEPLSKAVRDLARDQGKAIELRLDGSALEIDRRILDELKDSLLHLVRNCVDHGIERPAVRRAAGKPERGEIRIAVTQRDSNRVEFVVEDDGAGVALDRLAAAAAKLGLIAPDRVAAVGEAELLPLVFMSGVSTAPLLTELSGRGLGLAIVREKVERLGGTITIESRPGAGSRFRLLVPLTLATLRGIVVGVADRLLVLPTLGVERVLSGRRDQLLVLGQRPLLAVGGGHLPLVKLAELLDIAPWPGAGTDGLLAVVLGSAALRVAFEVDAVHGDQEVLVKPLGRMFERVRNVLGATVLADGTIAAILNHHDLLKSALKLVRTPAAQPAPAAQAAPRRVLVAEVSITARGLLKNILETAGYWVKTAVDGAEAWAMLELEPFDVVVSDVEMPRMNGFDLTARIRSDPRLAALPVVLVTARESREYRERGVDVVANAYVAKSDFDPQHLLDVLHRLT